MNEVLISVNLRGRKDAITFEALLSIQSFVHKLCRGAYVVMDNCSIYMGEVEKAIKSKGTKLIYLSPFSPDFLPMDNLCSKLKNILRSLKTTNYKELGDAI